MNTTLSRLDADKSATQRAPSQCGFLLAFVAPCVIGALLAGFSFAVLTSNNEQVGPVEAARIQHQQGGLYGSALRYRPYPYKLELYRLSQPDVAIVGSSRAMPFLRDGFSAPEISLGGAVNEIAEGERLIPEMLALHKPRLVIFTLDYWWFNEARIAEPTEFSASSDTGVSLRDLESCLVPGFNGALFSWEWKDALWDRFFTAAPRRQRRSVEQYKIVKRA
jgi:hypothetical protein